MLYRAVSHLSESVSILGIDLTRYGSIYDNNGTMELLELVIQLGVNLVHIDITDSLMNGTNNFSIKDLHKYRPVLIAATLFPCHFGRPLKVIIDRFCHVMGVDFLDFLIIGGINRVTWSLKYNLLEQIEGVLKEGKVKFVGVAIRDHYEIFRQILDECPFDLITIELSLLDVHPRPGLSSLAYAQQKGIAVFIKNDWYLAPWASGALENIDARIADILWLISQNAVTSILLPLDAELFTEALSLVKKEVTFTFDNSLMMANLRDQLVKTRPFRCAVCYACMPCPYGIDAPRIMELYTQAIVYKTMLPFKKKYFLEGHHRSACANCGKCSEACPRHIDIPCWLEEAYRLFAEINRSLS